MSLSENPDIRQSLSILIVPKGFVLDLERLEEKIHRMNAQLEVVSLQQRDDTLFLELRYQNTYTEDDLLQLGEVLTLEIMTGDFNQVWHQRMVGFVRRSLRRLFSDEEFL